MPRAFALLAAACAVAAAAFGAPARAEPVTIVELFASQGCRASAQALPAANALVSRPGVLLLAFPVDHWDYLGWRDSRARPEYAERHRRYAQRSQRAALATPQIVVNGRPAASPAEARASLEAPPGAPARLSAAQRGGRAVVRFDDGARSSEPLEVWLVSYDPAVRRTRITRGENAGLVLEERNVVTALTRLGPWAGGAQALEGPCQPRCAAIVQDRHGAVIAAIKVSPAPEG